MNEDKQAVVDAADAQAKPAAEVNDARDDGDNLDKLLTQYDEQVPKKVAEPKPEPQPGTESDLRTLAEQVKGFVSEANSIRYRQDMDQTIKAIRGDLDPEIFDDDLVESFVDGQARKDPRLQKAWIDRHANPKKFESVRDELGKNFAKKFSKLPDRQATEDREAVTAAVRGASTRAPEGRPANYADMSDTDFREDVRKKHGFMPI